LIFVLCGTQKQDFSRMIREVEKLADDHEIVVQAGHTAYTSDKMKIVDFMAGDELKTCFNRADYVMTHGGAGSMFESIKAGKKSLVFPRLKKYGEHVDDHQLQLAGKLQALGHLMVFNDGDEICQVFHDLQHFKMKPYGLSGTISESIDARLQVIFSD